MGMKIFELIFEVVSILAFVMTPLVVAWGWIRWARSEKRWTTLAVLSFCGFALATGSVALAVALSIYGHATGGFEFCDPRLTRVYAIGMLLSASGLILSLAGIWRFNSLRWHAFICSLGILVYWFALAEAE